MDSSIRSLRMTRPSVLHDRDSSWTLRRLSDGGWILAATCHRWDLYDDGLDRGEELERSPLAGVVFPSVRAASEAVTETFGTTPRWAGVTVWTTADGRHRLVRADDGYLISPVGDRRGADPSRRWPTRRAALEHLEASAA